MKQILATIAEGKILDASKARYAFRTLMEGKAERAEITAFLMGLRVRGEDAIEITEGAKILREKAKKLRAPENALDIVGTGGDQKNSLNISTATSFIVAGCGVPVAKHGNYAVSSKSGSADVLKALGVDLDAPFPLIEKAIREASIGFLMAPRHHSAMRHVASARQCLKIRTIFNILGPLANPAQVQHYLLGVYDRAYLDPMAHALKSLGAKRAWVVHSEEGFDELSPCGKSYVSALEDDKITSFEIHPEDAGLTPCREEELRGGDSADNAKAITDLLDNKPSGFLTACLLNAAAALVIAGKKNNLQEACTLARQSVQEGHAKAALRKLIDITNA